MIKIGYFEDFRSEDSILICVDEQGLQQMIQFFEKMAEAENSVSLQELKGMDLHYRKAVLAKRDDSPTGMRAVAKDAFEWKLPAARWLQFKGMAQNMRSGRGHQYLDCDDGDGKDLQVLLSMGEYDDAWWARFFQ